MRAHLPADQLQDFVFICLRFGGHNKLFVRIQALGAITQHCIATHRNVSQKFWKHESWLFEKWLFEKKREKFDLLEWCLMKGDRGEWAHTLAPRNQSILFSSQPIAREAGKIEKLVQLALDISIDSISE